MGKINLVIRDDLDEKFREEVFKRKGMKKGNLTESLEEALKLWIDEPILENLKKIATNPDLSPWDQEKAVKTIAEIGEYGALAKLSQIASEIDAYSSVRNLALEEMKRVKILLR